MMSKQKTARRRLFAPHQRADVRGRGPFKMLLDDYNALVIGHTGWASITRKTRDSQISRIFAQNGRLRTNRFAEFQKSSVKQPVMQGGVTSITNHRAIETHPAGRHMTMAKRRYQYNQSPSD